MSAATAISPTSPLSATTLMRWGPQPTDTVRVLTRDLQRVTVAGVMVYQLIPDEPWLRGRSVRLFLTRRTFVDGRVVWLVRWDSGPVQAAVDLVRGCIACSGSSGDRMCVDLVHAQLSRGLVPWPGSGVWERQEGHVHPHAFTLRSPSRVLEVICNSTEDAELWLRMLSHLVPLVPATAQRQPTMVLDPPAALLTLHPSAPVEQRRAAVVAEPPAPTAALPALPSASAPTAAIGAAVHPRPPSAPEFGSARAEFDFHTDASTYPDDLQLREGDLIQLLHSPADDAWWGGVSAAGQWGMFPRCFVSVRCHSCSGAFSQLRLTADARCQHYCCAECARLAVTTVLNDSRFPAHCFWCTSGPESEVGYMDDDAIQRLIAAGVVDADTGQRFCQLQLASAVGQARMTSCPYPGCGFRASVERPSVTRLTCPQCRRLYCHQCSTPWHSGQSCAQVAAAATSDQATAQVLSTTSKPCPRCGTPTTHYFEHGCHHIRPGGGCPARLADGTRCGQHWCYACGLAYAGRTPACVCRGWCWPGCGCPLCPIRSATGSCDCLTA